MKSTLTAMLRSRAVRLVSLALLHLSPVMLPGPVAARVEGYPYLDNETLGLVRALRDAVGGPVEHFEEVHWGLTLLEAIDGGDGMNPLRYFIAFSGYAVGQASVYTPAWREPYRQALGGYIDKMLLPLAWRDWLEVWGGDNPLGPDNVMYSGHLATMMTMYRQLFGDTRYEDGFELKWLDGEVVARSDARALVEWLAAQAATYVDAAGEPTYSIACEPGRIFVPCNAPHRASQIAYDALYGTGLSESNATWLAWVQERLLDPELGVLHELYFPFGKWQPGPESGEAPYVYEHTSGLYNGWSIWYIHALDPELAAQLYAAWRHHFVVSGADSPYADGRTVVVDKAGLDGLGALAFEVGATGFGLILAQLFDDAALYAELRASWDIQFGAPGWDEAQRQWSWWNPIFPRLIQNGFPLLALTTSPVRNIGSNAAIVRDADFFAAPVVRAVSDPDMFVNQAIWDDAARALVLTVNGGGATTARATVEIVGLDSARPWQVHRDGEPWTDVAWRDGVMVLTTAPLSPSETSYLVTEAPAEPAEPPPPVAESEPPIAEPPPPAPDTTEAHAEPEPIPAPPTTGGGGCGVGSPLGAHGMPGLPWAALLVVLAALGRRAVPGRRVVRSARVPETTRPAKAGPIIDSHGPKPRRHFCGISNRPAAPMPPPMHIDTMP